MIAEIPTAVDATVAWMEESGILANVMSEDAVLSLTSINWQEKMTELGTVVATGVGGVAQVAASAVSTTFSVIAKLVIGLIFGGVKAISNMITESKQKDEIMTLHNPADEEVTDTLENTEIRQRRFDMYCVCLMNLSTVLLLVSALKQ